MSALDELLNRWRNNPDVDATIALCSYLSTSGAEQLAREVGGNAETWHANDAGVMLAVGRMYLDRGLFQEAQTALVAAGKADLKDSRPFRFLGEVLLRRGDAARADKVLARARQLGDKDPDTKLWHERAHLFAGLQKRVGVDAVAREVERTMPRRVSIPPPTRVSDLPAVAESLTGDLLEEVSTGGFTPTHPRGRLGSGTKAPQGQDSADRIELESMTDFIEPAHERVEIESLSDLEEPEREELESLTDLAEPLGPPDGARPRFEVPVAAAPRALARPAPLPAPRVPPPPSPFVQTPSSRENPVPYPAPAVAVSAPRAAPAYERLPYPQAFAAPDTIPVQTPAWPVQSFDELSGVPAPSLVLEHLARVGVYEPGGGAAPAWEAAPRVKARGTWVLALAIVLVTAGGGGAYFYARQVKQERLAEAVELTREVEGMLQSGDISQLRASNDKLSRAIELDSLSQKAAKQWLDNRILFAMFNPGEPRGIGSATHRAREVGVEEKDYTAGRVAAFLVEGDLAGAAALLSQWDAKAGKDPVYQLAAGSVLERAGDLRAVERYEAAAALDPKSVFATMALARWVALELGAERAKPIVEKIAERLGDRAETRALRALVWAVDPDRPPRLPSNAETTAADRSKLPIPLKPIPSMIEALTALESGDLERAGRAIKQGVSVSETPAMATHFGFLAIQGGNEELARAAALHALQLSALYARARVLAARVALLGGRLDEAQKAIEELDPTSADVAVVRAVVAYETLDKSGLDAALESLGDDRERAEFSGLMTASGVIDASSYPKVEALKDFSVPHVPWGEIVAFDAALDQGELELAAELASAWKNGSKRPVYRLRLARLYRYQGKAGEAMELARTALAEGTPTATALIEYVYASLAAEEPKAARDAVAKFPILLGPMSVWLNILIDVASGREADASVKAGKEEPPPDAAPLALRILVGRALSVSKDKRARGYLVSIFRRVPKHPDVVLALEAL